MEVLSVAITAIFSVLVMLALAKLIGNRAISQMNMFDYINSITIGSIAAELAIADVEEITKPLVAMGIYAFAIILIAAISEKSLKFRRVSEGRSVILMENGKIINKNFGKAKIDINEFLMQCRLKGYFNLKDIKNAVLESNGRVSILPYPSARPVKPSDLKVVTEDEVMYTNVILDGKILYSNLSGLGYDKDWLMSELARQNIEKIEDVFLAVCNKNGECGFYEKQKKYDKRDMFDI